MGDAGMGILGVSRGGGEGVWVCRGQRIRWKAGDGYGMRDSGRGGRGIGVVHTPTIAYLKDPVSSAWGNGKVGYPAVTTAS